MAKERKDLRNTIKEIVKNHLLEKNGIAMGQCLTAVGWVGGTLPELYEDDGMVELSMADVAGSGFAVGAALAGKRPMYIIRYQGFNWFNAPIILNYACKSKEIWKRPCPLFIRSIAMEGGIGPVAGSSHHSLYYRMPGIVITSPMTPKEYRSVYDKFMKSDDVFYVSEHRGSYQNDKELKNIYKNNPDLVIFAISITRFSALDAANILNNIGFNISVINIFWIKPIKYNKSAIDQLKKSKYGGLVIDDDYTDGIAKSIANDLSLRANNNVTTMGLKNISAGFHNSVDNKPPNYKDIIRNVKKIIKNGKK